MSVKEARSEPYTVLGIDELVNAPQKRSDIIIQKDTCSYVLGDDYLNLREGRGGKFCRDRLFIFSISSTRKYISRYTKARLFIFIRNKILKKQNKKAKNKKQKTGTQKKPREREREGGGSECWFRRVPGPGQDFPWDFFLFLHTTRFCMCMCIYIIVSKRIVIEVGIGVLPQNYF